MSPMIALILAVVMVPVFAFVSITVWIDGRTKERKIFYRHELLKKLAESPAPQAETVLARLREEDRLAQQKLRDGIRLAGLINSFIGLGLLTTLLLLAPKHMAWSVGLIPLFVGAALLFYGYVLAPRVPPADRP